MLQLILQALVFSFCASRVYCRLSDFNLGCCLWYIYIVQATLKMRSVTL